MAVSDFLLVCIIIYSCTIRNPIRSRATPATSGEQTKAHGEWLVSDGEWPVSTLVAIYVEKCELVSVYSGLLKNFGGPLKIQG